MRHTPCGCRSADLVGVQTNFRLTRHYSMRQASAMPHSVGSLPPNATSHAPHDSKARLQNGDETHGFMAKPCTPHLIAQRVQLFKLQTANVGGRGELPSPFSGGFKGGILFGKRIPPLLHSRAAREQSAALRAAIISYSDYNNPFPPAGRSAARSDTPEASGT